MDIEYKDNNVIVDGTKYEPKTFIDKIYLDSDFRNSIVKDKAIHKCISTIKFDLTMCFIISIFGAIPFSDFITSIGMTTIDQILPLVTAHFCVWLSFISFDAKLWYDNSVKASTCSAIFKAKQLINNKEKENDKDKTNDEILTQEQPELEPKNEIDKKVYQIIHDIPEEYIDVPLIKRFIRELNDVLEIYKRTSKQIENKETSIRPERLDLIINNKLDQINFKIYFTIDAAQKHEISSSKIKKMDFKRE